uniref:Uncharacterized protein n=1 Tax=Romanomermis culicivorax TaxID=13658 RepID=A0A915JC11_ROMCU
MTIKETRALKALKSDYSIVILLAGRGKATVTMDNQDYHTTHSHVSPYDRNPDHQIGSWGYCHLAMRS